MAVSVSPLSILFACSEVVGFAKTGGLADVCGYLPPALAKRGGITAALSCLSIEVSAKEKFRSSRPITGWLFRWAAELFLLACGARNRQTQIPVFLVEHSDLFERDDAQHGRGIYQMTFPDGSKRDYPDNCARYVFFVGR